MPIPREWSDIRLEAGAALGDHVVLLCSDERNEEKLVIGSGTYVNRFTMFDASERIEIGRNCMIGPNFYIADHDHGQARDKPAYSQPLYGAPVILEDDVWLGAGAIVLKRVRIGRGAVVGAGSVVTKHVDPFTKVVGALVRTIGQK